MPVISTKTATDVVTHFFCSKHTERKTPTSRMHYFAGATSVRSWNVNNLASTNLSVALPL